MAVTIVAANLKTESGDNYLYLFDQVDGPQEFVELIERSMCEELELVSEIEIEVLYGDTDDYRYALLNRIDEMGENE